MEPKEEQDLEKLLGKGNIEKKFKKEVIEGKDGKETVIKDTRTITGLDGSEGITADELKKLKEFSCSCPSKGEENYGGKCRICGETFCNTIENGRRTCSRKCIYCHKRICMDHVRGQTGDDVYCSMKCFIFSRLRRTFSLKSIMPLFLILAVLIVFVILFNLVR